MLEKRRLQARQRALFAHAGTSEEQKKLYSVAVDCWDLFAIQTQNKIEQEIKEREVIEAGGTVDKECREHEALFLKW